MPDFTFRPLNIDTYFDKIFYINLKKDILRNDHMIKQFAQVSIKNYERIEAVVLEKLPEKYEYRNFIKNDDKYIYGSLSCRASHLKCFSIAKERNYQRIMILEDDVTFLENPSTILTNNIGILNDWDMLYFSGLIEPMFRNQIVGGYAYAVKETLFDNIINMAVTSGMEIDNFYAKILQHMSYNYNQSGKYNIRITLPFNTIVHTGKFQSNIQA